MIGVRETKKDAYHTHTVRLVAKQRHWTVQRTKLDHRENNDRPETEHRNTGTMPKAEPVCAARNALSLCRQIPSSMSARRAYDSLAKTILSSPIYERAKTLLFLYVLLTQSIKAQRHLRARGIIGTFSEFYTWIAQVSYLPIRDLVN